MITILINGKEYSLFEGTAIATKSMDAGSGTFKFDITSKEKVQIPILINDACEIYAKDTKVITGFVEGISGSYGPNNHDISISGRDKTADFIDSTIDVLTLTPPITLKRAIEIIIEQIGANIKVIDKVNPDPFSKTEDLVSAEVGDNAFEFALKLAKKKQVLLTVDGDGNLNIIRSTGTVSKAQIRHQKNSNNNNVKAASWDYNNTERFSRYKAVSQLNIFATEAAGIISSESLTNQQANEIVDQSIRKSRQLIFQAENLSGQKAAEERTKWEANIRKTRGRIYSCTLADYYADGIFLFPNLAMRVIDDFALINDVMLLNSVQYSFGMNGTECLLSFVDRNSYKLSLEEPENVGNSFFAKSD